MIKEAGKHISKVGGADPMNDASSLDGYQGKGCVKQPTGDQEAA